MRLRDTFAGGGGHLTRLKSFLDEGNAAAFNILDCAISSPLVLRKSETIGFIRSG